MTHRLQVYVNPAYDLQLEDVFDSLEIYPKWVKAGASLKIEINVTDNDVENLDTKLVELRQQFPQAQLMYTITPVTIAE